MKRLLVRNKRGKVSYGPKLLNTESSSESENDEDLHSTTITTAHEDQIPKGKRVEVSVKDGDLMYVAAIKGDWVAAEVLLDRDPKLVYDYITEEGDRALHVAVAMKHEEFVKKLVARMSDEDMALRNGLGYTALCYAAMCGTYDRIEISRTIVMATDMLKRNRNLVIARDEENAMPLRKAALRGNEAMLLRLMSFTKDKDLTREEWFDLLLLTIRGKMYAVATRILKMNESISTMADEEGTALHQLARVEASRKDDKFNELAKTLWDEMLKMDKVSLTELIRKPVHIIHEAAKAGRVKMITMLTRSFPKLVLDTDSNGYTMFHLAVMYRRTAVFNLFHQMDAMIGLRITWQDRQGNNILHLAAAKSASFSKMKLIPAHRMQREINFFEAVKEIVPPSCLMTRNRGGLTPEELFSKAHKKLLKKSEIWMINKADSLMLIATIMLTVVFAAAFTVPGGYVGHTGEPVLAKKRLFTVFFISEIISLVGSLLSIMIFQCIMTSRFAQEEFLDKLPWLMRVGFQSLFVSLVGAFVTFIASISLFKMDGVDGFKWFGVTILVLYGLFWAIRELTSAFRYTTDRISDREDTLFQQKLVKRRFNMIWKNILMSWKEFLLACISWK